MTSNKRIWDRLDKVDKQLSEPIFALRLPFAILEFLLSIPGNWFGSCCFASSTLPSLIAICFDGGISEWHPWYGLVGFMICIVLTLWLLVLSPSKSAISKTARDVFYGPAFGAIAPAIGVTVLAISPLSTMAKTMGYFQICSWSIGVLPTATLKPCVKRERPASWILNNSSNAPTNERIKRLQKAAEEKHINTLPKLFTRDAKASFPSGDTAGAMSTMYSLIFLYPESMGFRILGIICVVLSCVGRMYFLAHHLLDVLTGALTAYFACVGLELLFCDETGCKMEWWVPLAGHLVLLTMVILTRWMFNWKVFAAGTVRVDDGDEDGKGKKEE